MVQKRTQPGELRQIQREIDQYLNCTFGGQRYSVKQLRLIAKEMKETGKVEDSEDLKS